MPNPIKGSWEYVVRPNYSRIAGLIVLLVIAVAVPLTVYISQKQQQTRSLAQCGTDGNPCIPCSQFPGISAPVNTRWEASCGQSCTANSQCPQNTGDPSNINASTSNWCYGFNNGNFCMQLKSTGGGGTTSGGGSAGGGTAGTGPAPNHCQDSHYTGAGSADACQTCVVGNLDCGSFIFITNNGHVTDDDVYNTQCGLDPAKCNNIKNQSCQSQCGLAPTATPIPTQPVVANDTTLSLKLSLSGIGGTDGNKSPVHVQRNVTVCLYDSQTNPANDLNCTNATLKKSGVVTYDPSVSQFTNASFDLGPGIASGNYQVLIKTDRYLRKLVPGVQPITAGSPNPIPASTLIVGDINGDNKIDINDYNALFACFGSKANACNNKDSADLDDNGVVDGTDYNLFLRSISVQSGD